MFSGQVDNLGKDIGEMLIEFVRVCLRVVALVREYAFRTLVGRVCSLSRAYIAHESVGQCGNAVLSRSPV